MRVLLDLLLFKKQCLGHIDCVETMSIAIIRQLLKPTSSSHKISFWSRTCR